MRRCSRLCTWSGRADRVECVPVEVLYMLGTIRDDRVVSWCHMSAAPSCGSLLIVFWGRSSHFSTGRDFFCYEMSDCMQGWISMGLLPSQSLTHRCDHVRSKLSLGVWWYEDAGPKPASAPNTVNGTRPLLSVVTLKGVSESPQTNRDKQLNSLVVMTSHHRF